MKILILSVGILAALVAATALYTRTAHCAYCSTVPCWGAAMCGQGCYCMRQNDHSPGTCVTF